MKALTVVKQLLTIFLLLALAACKKHGLAISVTEDAMAQISEQVNILIADTSCDDPNDCAAIGWGIDPCGNFRSFLVYNASQVDESALERLAGQYNQLDRELNQLTEAEITTDCAVLLVEPLLECLDQVCDSQGDRYVVVN
jgi:hypothetical protein